MTSGVFITLEGGEGCGKSTQSKLLFEALNRSDTPTLHTREPGGTDGAEQIRHLLVEGETGRWDKTTETLLYFAARKDHVEKLIKPSLDRGEWVVCDRFTDSTIAYQGYGHGVKLEFIHGLHKLVLGDCTPKLTVVLDIDPEKGMDRAHAREEGKAVKEDRYERMGSIFHKNVRRGFLELASHNPDRYAVIDGTDSILDVHRNVIRQVNFHLRTQINDLSSKEIQSIIGA